MQEFNKTYWKCALASLALLAIMMICVWVFDINITPYLVTIGLIFILALPWYIAIRNKGKDEEVKEKHQLSEEIEDIENSLEEIKANLEDCQNRLLKVEDYEMYKGEMQKKTRIIENFDEELTAIECIDSCLEEVESISNALTVLTNQVT